MAAPQEVTVHVADLSYIRAGDLLIERKAKNHTGGFFSMEKMLLVWTGFSKMVEALSYCRSQ